MIVSSLAITGGAVLAGCSSSPPWSTPSEPLRTAAPTASGPTESAPTTATPVHAPALSVAVVVNTAATPSPRRLIGYFAGWSIDRNYHVADLPADKLSHVNYAFANVSSAGECVAMSARVDQINLPELRQLKRQHPTLRTSISINASGKTNYYPLAARTDESRQRFARSAIAFMKQNDFDGIDLDWEYPSADEASSFTALLAELRRQLDATGDGDGKRYLLTIAAPAGPNHYADLELGLIHQHVDWINLMTYAFHGTWSAITNFNAPLFSSSSDPSSIIQRLAYNTDAAVLAYLAAGVPAAKLVVGVPFYGSGWKGVPDTNHGLYQHATGIPAGTRSAGIFEYQDLQANYLGTYTRYWHDEAKVPWLYNPATGIMITYDDPESLGAKADYVRSQNLGGVMAWELSTDDRAHSLVNALHAHLS